MITEERIDEAIASLNKLKLGKGGSPGDKRRKVAIDLLNEVKRETFGSCHIPGLRESKSASFSPIGGDGVKTYKLTLKKGEAVEVYLPEGVMLVRPYTANVIVVENVDDYKISKMKGVR